MQPRKPFYVPRQRKQTNAMLIGTVAGSVLGLQIVIDRLVAAQRRKRKAARSYP